MYVRSYRAGTIAPRSACRQRHQRELRRHRRRGDAAPIRRARPLTSAGTQLTLV
jgi:hypothetical protein